MSPSIAIFDSGLGGLTTARRLAERLPGVHLCYCGDTAGGPYGGRSRRQIRIASKPVIEWLANQKPDLLIIASHSACAAWREDPFWMSLDIETLLAVDVCIARALSLPGAQRIGVIAEEGVVDAADYRQALGSVDPRLRLFANACPLFGPLVMAGRLKKPETAMVVKKYLHPLKVRQIDVLIMGSSQYGPLLPVIRRKLARRTKLVDPADAITVAADRLLDENGAQKGRRQFYVTDWHPRMLEAARQYYGRNVELKPAPFTFS